MVTVTRRIGYDHASESLSQVFHDPTDILSDLITGGPAVKYDTAHVVSGEIVNVTNSLYYDTSTGFFYVTLIAVF